MLKDIEIKVEGNSTEYIIINNLLYLFKKVLLLKLYTNKLFN